MRYRLKDGAMVEAYGSTEPWLWLTVALSLIIGGVLGWLAWRGKQRWLLIWSVGLVLSSVAYAGYDWFYA